jgi:hypothetical protein
VAIEKNLEVDELKTRGALAEVSSILSVFEDRKVKDGGVFEGKNLKDICEEIRSAIPFRRGDIIKFKGSGFCGVVDSIYKDVDTGMVAIRAMITMANGEQRMSFIEPHVIELYQEPKYK